MGNNKKDIVFSLVCGELTSWFCIFVIKNPYVTEFQGLAKIGSLVWILPIVLPIVFLIGFLVAQFASKFISVIGQIVKFGEIGVMNTFVDLGILNLLIWITGITSGWGLAPLNSVSFLFAATNSYFWNKFWTFKTGGQATGKNFLQFLLVSGVGWGINTGILVLGTKYLAPMFGLSAGGWLNMIKLTATFVAMFWNFLGYKFIVFKKTSI